MGLRGGLRFNKVLRRDPNTRQGNMAIFKKLTCDKRLSGMQHRVMPWPSTSSYGAVMRPHDSTFVNMQAKAEA